MEAQEREEKYTSEALENILAQLSTDQIRFVVARQEFSTDKEAAEAIGVSPQTVYRWPDTVKDAVRLMATDGLVTAQIVRKRALAKAMLVKVGGLDLRDDRLRQAVATEIIEWEMGRAMQRQEVSGPDRGPLEISDANSKEYNRAISTLADAVGALLLGAAGTAAGGVDAAEQEAVDGDADASG